MSSGVEYLLSMSNSLGLMYSTNHNTNDNNNKAESSKNPVFKMHWSVSLLIKCNGVIITIHKEQQHIIEP